MTDTPSVRSPVDLLASIFFDGPGTSRHGISPPRLVVICGSIGAGKTSWCRRLIGAAQSHNLRMAGVLSPGVFVGSEKIAIDLQDVETGETRRLAARRMPDDPPCPITGALNWIFDMPALTWGNTVLSRRLSVDSGGDADILILDELGVLEFTRNRGLTAGFQLIDACRYRLACMTIRPALLAAVHSRWPWAEVHNLDQDVQPL